MHSKPFRSGFLEASLSYLTGNDFHEILRDSISNTHINGEIHLCTINKWHIKRCLTSSNGSKKGYFRAVLLLRIPFNWYVTCLRNWGTYWVGHYVHGGINWVNHPDLSADFYWYQTRNNHWHPPRWCHQIATWTRWRYKFPVQSCLPGFAC